MSQGCSDLEILVDRDSHMLKGVKLGVACACFSDNKSTPERTDMFEKIREELASRLRNLFTLEKLREHPVVRAYRSYYWKIGIDPTKTRPAGEALARRLLQGRPFNSINPIVDAGNLASAETLVPIGIYDLKKSGKKMALRVSKGGETFIPLGGSERSLEPGIPILVNSEGLVMHVFPHRDSRLTAVTTETTCVVILAAGVPDVDNDLIVKSIKKVREYAEKLGLEVVGWSGVFIT